MFHSLASLGARHPLPDNVYADETARLAATGFTSDDVWKAYGQESDETLWLLVNHSPITWVELSGGSGGTISNVQYVQQFNLLTTTLTTFQDVLVLTMPVDTPEGLYCFSAKWAWYYTGFFASAKARAYVDSETATPIIQLNQQPISIGTDQIIPASGFDYRNLAAGSHTFRLQHASSGGGATSGCRHVVLEVCRVGDRDDI